MILSQNETPKEWSNTSSQSISTSYCFCCFEPNRAIGTKFVIINAMIAPFVCNLFSCDRPNIRYGFSWTFRILKTDCEESRNKKWKQNTPNPKRWGWKKSRESNIGYLLIARTAVSKAAAMMILHAVCDLIFWFYFRIIKKLNLEIFAKKNFFAKQKCAKNLNFGKILKFLQKIKIFKKNQNFGKKIGIHFLEKIIWSTYYLRSAETCIFAIVYFRCINVHSRL